MPRGFRRRSRTPRGAHASRAPPSEFTESVIDLTNSDGEVHNVWSSESDSVNRRMLPNSSPPPFGARGHLASPRRRSAPRAEPYDTVYQYADDPLWMHRSAEQEGIPSLFPRLLIPHGADLPERWRVNVNPDLFHEPRPELRAGRFCAPRPASAAVPNAGSLEFAYRFPVAPPLTASNSMGNLRTTTPNPIPPPRFNLPEYIPPPVPSQARPTFQRRQGRLLSTQAPAGRRSTSRFEQRHLQNVERLANIQRELRMIHAALGSIRIPGDRSRSRDRDLSYEVHESSTDSDASASTPSPMSFSPSAASVSDDDDMGDFLALMTPPSTPRMSPAQSFAPPMPMPPMPPALPLELFPLIPWISAPVTPPMLGSVFESPTNVPRTRPEMRASGPATPSFSPLHAMSASGPATPSFSQLPTMSASGPRTPPFRPLPTPSFSQLQAMRASGPRTPPFRPLPTPSFSQLQAMSASGPTTPPFSSLHAPQRPRDEMWLSPMPLPPFLEVPLSPRRDEGSSSDVRRVPSTASAPWLSSEDASGSNVLPHQSSLRSEPDIPCYFYTKVACSHLRISEWCPKCGQRFRGGAIVVGCKRKMHSPDWMHISCFLGFATATFSDVISLVCSREYLAGRTGNAQTLAAFHRLVPPADRDRLLHCFNRIGSSANLEAWTLQSFGATSFNRSWQHQPSLPGHSTGDSDAQNSDLGARMTRDALFPPVPTWNPDDDYQPSDDDSFLNFNDSLHVRRLMNIRRTRVLTERLRARQRRAEQEIKVQRIIDSAPVTTSDFHGECCICMEPIVRGRTTIRTLPCKHAYHNACIDEWMRRKTVCPLDNLEIEV